MKLIVANWKSHKTNKETQEFFNYLAEHKDELRMNNTTLLICPSYTSLPFSWWFTKENSLPVSLGAQDVSPFPEGAYTGEIAATQLKDYVEYVIIGHSERRSYFQEAEDMIEQKVKQAKNAGLKVIQCVQDAQGVVYDGVDVVAFEPVSAIGTGNPDDPADVGKVFQALASRYPSVQLLYGGSVDNKDVTHYLSVTHLGGFLVGGASLDPLVFTQLARLCDTENS